MASFLSLNIIYLDNLDQIRIHFNPGQLAVLNFCLGFLMFGVALELRTTNFRIVLRYPKAVVAGLLSQWGLLPLLTILLIWLLQPPPSLALGMLLVAACPGGNVSNYAVHLGKGNTELSVVLTTISTIGAILITPLYFSWMSGWMYAESRDVSVSAVQMMGSVVQLIAVPLVLGMGMRHYFPALTARVLQPVKWLSMLIFIGFVAVAVVANRENIGNYLHLVFLLVLIHNALALAGGYGLAKAFGLPAADARAIAIETGIQNSGLGLILIFNYFGGLGGMAMIAAWWGIWHLVSAFTLALVWRNAEQSRIKSLAE